MGYYINDNYSTLFAQYDKAIEEMKSQKIILSEYRVSLRTQIVVEQKFHIKGIPTVMLSFLKPSLKHKYDLPFSIGINENPKRIAHEKAGWNIIHENEFNYYGTYDLKK